MRRRILTGAKSFRVFMMKSLRATKNLALKLKSLSDS